MIGRLLKDLQIPTKFVDGLRVTDEKTLEVVEMVLSGLINKEIVKNINDMGGRAIGLSGKDGRLLMAKRVDDKDIGFVGDIVDVNVDIIKNINKNGYIPVIAPLADGVDGHSYNINADTAAQYATDAKKLQSKETLAGVLEFALHTEKVYPENIDHGGEPACLQNPENPESVQNQWLALLYGNRCRIQPVVRISLIFSP